jgi:hypothetical protein
LDGGEREQGALAPAAATMAAAMARAARCGARGEAEGLNTRLGLPVGDAVMTVEIPAVLQRLEVRAYGGDAADGPPVRGACARMAACASGHLGTGRFGGAGIGTGRGTGVEVSGSAGTDAGAWPAAGGDGGARGAHDVARGALWPWQCC